MDNLMTLQRRSKKSLVEKFGGLSVGQLGDFELLKGKYKGKKYFEVLEEEPNYCDWVLNNVKSNTSPLSLFKLFLDRKILQAIEIEKNSNLTHYHTNEEDNYAYKSDLDEE